MATINWDGTTSKTVAYSSSNTIVFDFDPAETLADIRNADGSVLFVTTDGNTLVLSGVQLAQIEIGDIVFAGGAGDVIFGDGTSSTLTDNVGNTITLDSDDAFGIAMGLGGSDTINAGGSGNHLIFGGSAAGDSADSRDVINSGYGTDVVYGNAGDDFIHDEGGAANELYGGSGNDEIYAHNDGSVLSDSVVSGGIGEDYIEVSSATGTTTVYGGNEAGDPLDGDDVIDVYSYDGETNVYGNGGDDVIYGNHSGTGSLAAYGGLGDDDITLYSGSADSDLVVVGGKDADTIDVETYGNATIWGGSASNDPLDTSDVITLNGHGGLYSVYGNGGEDDITVDIDDGASAMVHGGADDDTIVATSAAADALSTLTVNGGLGGDDITVASDGAATVFGGSAAGDPADGSDTITVTGAGQFDVYGNGGADTIDVTLSGVVGSADTLIGHANIYGGQGVDDISINGDGSYFVKAGIGDDTINIDLNAADATFTGASAYVYGNEGADTFVFNTDSTGDTGTGAAVTVIGDYDHGEGDVITVTGDMTDFFTGGNVLLGDYNGNGTLDLVISSGSDVLNIEHGAEELTQVDFADGSFIFDGSADSNNLIGTAGDDVIIDGGGLYGPTLGDGELPDTLDGGAGDDLLVSGYGADTVTGGSGSDTFYYFAPLQSTLDGYDVITDFMTGEDMIDVSNVVNGTATLDTRTGDYALLYDSFEEAVNALADADGSSDSQVITFTYNSQSYVFVDNSENMEFDEQDLIINLANNAPITAADFNFGFAV
ncbi:MAG TPA: calcium-binding protein [Sphingomicrobium sp.]|jgi:Ca2+-binding RTX toxin-like protein